MTPDLEISRDIAASPEAVFAVISDIGRIGELSPENDSNEWNEGFDTAAVGAVWTGNNRNGDNEWTTESIVVEYAENERFFFDCRIGDFVFAKWGYAIEPTDSGCRVTEFWQDQRPDEMRGKPSKLSGVTDRVEHNRVGMETTLERLAAAVE